MMKTEKQVREMLKTCERLYKESNTNLRRAELCGEYLAIKEVLEEYD